MEREFPSIVVKDQTDSSRARGCFMISVNWQDTRISLFAC